MVDLECLQVTAKKVIFTQCRLVDRGMDETLTPPLAVDATGGNLCVEQIKTGPIDSIDAAIILQLARIKSTIELAGGNGKAGIPAGCTLPHTARIQQKNFLIGMQQGQTTSAGQPGQAGTNHRPGNAFTGPERIA